MGCGGQKWVSCGREWIAGVKIEWWKSKNNSQTHVHVSGSQKWVVGSKTSGGWFTMWLTFFSMPAEN